MFADPTVVTINAVAKNLLRINQDGYASEYFLKGTLDEFKLSIRNTERTDKTYGRVIRHAVELVQLVYPVSPAVTGLQRKAYAVLEHAYNDTTVDVAKFAAGLSAFLTEANWTKTINMES